VLRRHRSAPLLALTALALLAPAPAGAAGVATFRLMNTDPAGSAPVTEALARVLPPGTVIARDVNTDPPSILDPSTGYVSSGFNPDDLQIVLGDGTTTGGDPFQAIKLDFGPGGISPGGRLYFQLNKSPSYDDMVRLVLPTTVGNLVIETIDDTAPSPGEGAGGDGGTQVPEPLSLVVWAALAGTGLWRARAARRLRAAT
jgi:hypothetical protein